VRGFACSVAIFATAPLSNDISSSSPHFDCLENTNPDRKEAATTRCESQLRLMLQQDISEAGRPCHSYRIFHAHHRCSASYLVILADDFLEPVREVEC
jgi:hypothetical protein